MIIGLALIVVIRLAVPGFLPQRALLLPATLLAFIGLLSARLIFSRSTESQLRRRVLVLGVGERAKRLEGLRRASDCIGIVIVGFVDVGAGPSVIDPARTIVATGALPELVKRFDVDDLVVALDDRRSRLPEAELLQCKMSGVRVLDDSQFLEQQQVRISLDGIKAGDAQAHVSVEQVVATGQALEGIKASAVASLGLIDGIALATREQSSAASDIARNVEQIALMSENSASAVRGIADASQALAGVAAGLNDTLARVQV
jgi:hypothetical protein